MTRIPGSLLIAILLGLAPGREAAAEVFLLKNGGRIEGELLNPDQDPRKTFLVKTSSGVQITLSTAQIEKIQRRRPEELEYDRIQAHYPDTVEGQWELAEWCRPRRLSSQRTKHLERILELDTDHELARRALGYAMVGNTWKTHEQKMLDQGFRRYKGRWLLPQQIELLERDREDSLASAEWKRKLKLWRGWLGSDKSRLARENLLEIDDPAAVDALADVLQDDRRDQVRLLMIEALARIGTADALGVLASGALSDSVEEVRLTCLDYLKEKKDPRAVAYFVAQLREKDNGRINRAAQALRHMEDPSAIGPLIGALVTVHKFKTAGNPGRMNPTFDTSGRGGGGGGLAMGGGPQIITRSLQNRQVLEALVALTGVNFDYDVRRWNAWSISQRSRPGMDVRRN